jgi:hypothetical protein
MRDKYKLEHLDTQDSQGNISYHYSSMEDLYRQFKVNFENKKQWQFAGDFHI